MPMEAIILAGGQGTRLKSLFPDLPKALVPIQGRVFLEFLLDFLIQEGINRVVLSLGYQYKKIQNYFKEFYYSLPIVYSIESEPLGTGGAIQKALKHCKEKNIFVFNGDTLFHVPLNSFMKAHKQHFTFLSIALKKMENTSRYGFIQTQGEEIIGFQEKQTKDKGFINGGVYILQKELFSLFDLKTPFSFEKDILEKHAKQIHAHAFFTESHFIDIGTEKDYQRAQKEIPFYWKIK